MNEILFFLQKSWNFLLKIYLRVETNSMPISNFVFFAGMAIAIFAIFIGVVVICASLVRCNDEFLPGTYSVCKTLLKCATAISIIGYFLIPTICILLFIGGICFLAYTLYDLREEIYDGLVALMSLPFKLPVFILLETKYQIKRRQNQQYLSYCKDLEKYITKNVFNLCKELHATGTGQKNTILTILKNFKTVFKNIENHRYHEQVHSSDEQWDEFAIFSYEGKKSSSCHSLEIQLGLLTLDKNCEAWEIDNEDGVYLTYLINPWLIKNFCDEIFPFIKNGWDIPKEILQKAAITMRELRNIEGQKLLKDGRRENISIFQEVVRLEKHVLQTTKSAKKREEELKRRIGELQAELQELPQTIVNAEEALEEAKKEQQEFLNSEKGILADMKTAKDHWHNIAFPKKEEKESDVIIDSNGLIDTKNGLLE